MSPEFWYLSRAAGFTAYLLLFSSAVLGMAMSSRFAARLRQGNLAFDLHRFISVLALAFSLFHVYVLLGDRYFSFNVWDLSLPFRSPYRAIPTAVGVLSMYALVLIVASFYVKKWIGYRTWRAVHGLTFVMYLGVTAHGITAGTDTTQPWARALYVATAATIVVLGVLRLNQALAPHPKRAETAKMHAPLRKPAINM